MKGAKQSEACSGNYPFQCCCQCAVSVGWKVCRVAIREQGCLFVADREPTLQNVWQDWEKGACDQCMQRGEPNFKPSALDSMAEETAPRAVPPATPPRATTQKPPQIEQAAVVPHQVVAQDQQQQQRECEQFEQEAQQVSVTASLVRGGPMVQQAPPAWMSGQVPQQQPSMPQVISPVARSMSFQYEEGLGPPFQLKSLESAMTWQDGNDAAPLLIGHEQPQLPYQPPWVQQQEWDEGAARRQQQQQQRAITAAAVSLLQCLLQQQQL